MAGSLVSTARQRMLAALSGSAENGIPVTPHWWGPYKFWHQGIIQGYEDDSLGWNQSAPDLARIDASFYDEFHPDMFHLTTAPTKNVRSFTWDEYMDARKKASSLTSKQAIDDYVNLWHRSPQETLQSGEFDHIVLLRQKYGDEAFLALNEGSETSAYFDGHLGFEAGLIGLLEHPENTQYYLKRLYDNTFDRMLALKETGCDAFINSETYCSADVMSPTLYHDIIYPVQHEFYQKLSAIGIIPIVYFTGNILPMLNDIKTLPVRGLMIEESKKDFVLDVGEIAARLEGTMALFGNLDSVYVMQMGSPDDVRTETLRQLRATQGCPFIMANGCPLSFHTPPENIHAMIETVRRFESS